MGQNDVKCEALAGVSVVDDWSSGLRRNVASRSSRTTAQRMAGLRQSAIDPARLVDAARSGRLVAPAVLGAAVVALLLAFALRSFSVNAPAVRAAVETTMTLFALAGAWLLRTQFAHARRMRDLLLLGGFLVLGITNFWTAALPAALNLRTGAYFPAAEFWGSLAVGAIFAAAACVPSRRLVTGSRHPLAVTTLLGLAVLVVAAVGALVVGGQGQEAATGAATVAGSFAHPQLLILALIAAGPLAYAATGFARRYRIEADRGAALLAIAMMLLAFVSMSHLVTLSVSPGRVGPGEGLRMIAFALLLAAAATAERRARARQARGAALAERRRVARDLHDGLAQDLAFIAAHGPRIAQEMGDEHPIVIAARRALAISRNAISELSDPEGATAHESLEAVAQELRDRFDVAIAVDAHLDADLPSAAREHVSRIAREAIANAARHGGARNVVVSLRSAPNGVALRVVDDGCGIAGADGEAAPEGFGLSSMRERAAALGGHMSVRPARRGGTELEVVLP
jgi:signal transduction histidine kinase